MRELAVLLRRDEDASEDASHDEHREHTVGTPLKSLSVERVRKDWVGDEN